MRTITTHIVKGDSVNHQLKIEATDKPGAGGANQKYEISGFSTATNPSEGSDDVYTYITILFQNGSVKDVGVNGITNEALTAILIDRMEGFRSGKFKCVHNTEALYHFQEALKALQARTQERIHRQVEGTHQL